ncbi:MAG: hypothetical protein ACFE91_08415 [Promethearchaeota archaeon]
MRNKKFIILVLFLFGFMFFSSTLGVVMATDDDSDGVEDEFEEEHERDISPEIEEDKTKIQSILRSGTDLNKIEFEIINETEGLSIKVEFIPNYIPDSNTSQIELEFEVTFRKIVEYIDIDSDGVFNDSIDTEVSELELIDFKDPIYMTSDISMDTKLHYFEYTTSDDVFTAYIYFVEEFEIVNNTLITPTETKIDIEINNYNYLNDSSQLALYTKLESEVEYESENETEDEESGYAENESSVYTMINTHVGFFSWKENATIDNVSKIVLNSQIDDDDDEPNEQKIYFNYPRGTLIYHDPKIGIEGLALSIEGTNGNDGISTISSYEILAIIGVSILGIVGSIYAIKKKCKS